MDTSLNIYGKSGEVLLKIKVDDNSYRYRAIMNSNSVSLYYSLDNHVEIPVGSYIIYQGERYTLWRPENFKKNGSRNFEYTVEFGGNQEILKMSKFKDLSIIPYRLKFSFTGTPEQFVRILVNNLNLYDSGWMVGRCMESCEKPLSFNHEYCYDVLGRLASEFSTEWEIIDKTISLCKVERFKDYPLALSYGKGNGIVPGTGRANQGNKQPVTLLYVQGGERNIDFSKYKSKTLLLPVSQELEYEKRRYRTDEYGMYITRSDRALNAISEDSYDAISIYPSRVGTVSKVETIIKNEGKDNEFTLYDIIDSSIPNELDYSKCRIAGETATIVFQSGRLSGREFDIEQTEEKLTGYVHSERRFKLVSAEIDGLEMPNSTYLPKAGDKYAIFNISLPDAYICNNDDKSGASWDMFRDAARYFYEHEESEFTFSGTLDGIWAKKRWLDIGGQIVPGGHVLFSDTQFQPDGISIRITGVKDYINKPHSPEIELSNTPVAGYVASELGKIDANEVVAGGQHKDALQFTKRRFRDAKETMDMLAGALLNFSGAINPITIQTMQLLVGDESLQFRFVNSKTNPVAIAHNITYNGKTKSLMAPAGILQHMTLGISSIASTHKSEEYRFWDMALYSSPFLEEPETKYYLYAKVGKSNSGGDFILSETAIEMEGVTDYYHLLVGVLNSEYEGERSFVELYGFTEILPGRVTTDLIISSDGKTYFSLLKGEIGGNIKIKAGSSGLDNLAEWAQAESDIKNAKKSAEDAKNAVTDLNDYVDGSFADGIITEAEAKAIEKYINTVNGTKATVEATYAKLYANTYLSGTPKTNLLNAKVTLMGSIDNLIKSINTAIVDGATTVAEKKDVDNKYAEFNSSYADFNAAVEAANKAIQDVLKSYSDGALKEAQQAIKDAADAAEAANQANASVEDLSDYVDGSFADGIITEAEAKAIEKYINTVNGTKATVEATYAKLYANSYLLGSAKVGLLNAKVTLFGTIDNLIASINAAIGDGTTTVAEKQDVDSKFASFNSALAGFNTAVEVSNKAIQDELKRYSDECTAELDILNDKIVAQVERVDNLTGIIDTSGWITKADANTLYASKTLESGETLISYINQASGSTTISSAKINLLGSVTINALDSSLQGKINSMISSSDLGTLAFKDAVEAAQLGSTIIVGGYLNTDLIKVRRIDADSGFIGGFTIEGGRLIWTRSDYFGGTSRSLKLGSGTSKEGVVNVTFNPATDGRFGVCAVGAADGGSAAIYGSSKTNPIYPSDYIYAGYFDGNVNVNGDVSANGFYPRDGNGNTMSVVSDSWISINDMIGRKFHVVKGLIVEARG